MTTALNDGMVQEFFRADNIAASDNLPTTFEGKFTNYLLKIARADRAGGAGTASGVRVVMFS